MEKARWYILKKLKVGFSNWVSIITTGSPHDEEFNKGSGILFVSWDGICEGCPWK